MKNILRHRAGRSERHWMYGSLYQCQSMSPNRKGASEVPLRKHYVLLHDDLLFSGPSQVVGRQDQKPGKLVQKVIEPWRVLGFLRGIVNGFFEFVR